MNHSPSFSPHRLGELCRIFQGLSISRHSHGPLIHPIVYISDLKMGRISPAKLNTIKTEEWAWTEYGLEEGDVVISAKGAIGKTAIVLEKSNYLLSSNLIALRPKQELIYPAFLYAFFATNHATRQLETFVHSSATVKSIRPSDLSDLMIPVPEMVVQERLGKLALAYDAYEAHAHACLSAAKNIFNEVMTSQAIGRR
jgi:restriction endonuclease S subunit